MIALLIFVSFCLTHLFGHCADQLKNQKSILENKKKIVRSAALSPAYTPATGVLLAHAHKIQKECSVPGEILYFAGPMSMAGRVGIIRYVTMMESVDPHHRNFGLYHEMGHILHDDIVNSDNKYKEILNKPFFKADLNRMQRYLDAGRKNIPKNTRVGDYIQRMVQQNPRLWIRPLKVELYERMLYIRGKEQRADLYAFDMIAKRKIYQVLISALLYFGLSDFVIARGMDHEHPSDIERALCILGFLAEKKINIGAHVQKYEREHQLFFRSHR